MQQKDCYYLGAITKAHGYKGELIIHMDTDEPHAYNNLESIFIERNGLLVPFFLKKAQLHKEKNLRILLEDFDEPTSLIGRNVFLPLSTLPSLADDKFYYHEVVGFKALNVHNQLIGEIQHVRDTGSQDLFEILSTDQKEILIPVIDEWIVEVNKAEKLIRLNLPEGLLDVF